MGLMTLTANGLARVSHQLKKMRKVNTCLIKSDCIISPTPI